MKRKFSVGQEVVYIGDARGPLPREDQPLDDIPLGTPMVIDIVCNENDKYQYRVTYQPKNQLLYVYECELAESEFIWEAEKVMRDEKKKDGK